jgi:glycosyltransferase involved in cell wall biosynthesis
MHITIDCRMWGEKYGGIGRYTKDIVLQLINQNQWEFTLLCSTPAFQDLKCYENSIISLKPCTSPIFSLKEQWEIWRKVPCCDLFWSPYMNIPFVRTRAKKQIVTLHDVFHLANPQYYSRLKRIVIAPYYYFSTRYSDKILTVSNFSKSEINKYFGKHIADKVSVIYNGCEIKDEDIQPKEIGFKYFLFVGSIKPHKNLKNALLGFQQLNNKNYKFIIVGKKEGFITGDQSIFNLVSQINAETEKVLFTGNINDQELYAWYKGASALVMPSYYEGFGLPIIEAMHFNIPIIASNIPVLKEIGKKYISYFNPYDPDSIKNAMTRIIQYSTPTKYPQWRTWAETAEDIAHTFEQVTTK